MMIFENETSELAKSLGNKKTAIFMTAVCIGDTNEIGLFALLSAPLRPRSAQASPAYSRLLASKFLLHRN